MKSWLDILSSPNEQFGPNSLHVYKALSVMENIEWLKHVGEPLQEPFANVTLVGSWDEALSIYAPSDEDEARYTNRGTLLVARERLMNDITSSPEPTSWWYSANTRALALIASRPVGIDHYYRGTPEHICDAVDLSARANIYDWAMLLLGEIIVSPSYTYFRDQLPWYCAGRYPCGWDGNWPEGRMRIY